MRAKVGMTRSELLEKLREQHCPLGEFCDAEDRHFSADMLLLDYIDDPEIRAAFLAVKRWYA